MLKQTRLFTGGIMKKIIVILLLITASIGIGNNLDQYESKRVFDKIIEVILTGNYEKYKNNSEMSEAIKNLVKSSRYFDAHRVFSNGNKYIVLDVDEQKNKSILTVKAVYKVYSSISDEKYKEIMKRENLELIKYDNEEIDEETYKKNFYNIITDVAGDNFQIKEETIKIDMVKNKGWDLADNSELIKILYPAVFEIMESLNTRYFKTED